MSGLPQSGHLRVISRILEKGKAGDNQCSHLSKCRDWDNAVLVGQFWLKTSILDACNHLRGLSKTDRTLLESS